MHPREYRISADPRDPDLAGGGVEAVPEGPAEVIGDQDLVNVPEAPSDAGAPYTNPHHGYESYTNPNLVISLRSKLYTYM